MSFLDLSGLTRFKQKLDVLLSGKLSTNLKGAANGLAELDSSGKVPSSQLPSYVDDVEEYASLSAFPATGESGKVYIAIDTNITYRWGGTEYVPIGSDLALGETSSTAYRGDRGKAAYDAAVVNVDSSPSSGSANLVTSGGVYTAMDNKADKTDTVLNTTLSRGRKANTTVGTGSFAFGNNVTASNDFAHAEGNATKATGGISHAEGQNTTASGGTSHAEGQDTTASGSQSHAEGYNTTASGNQAHAEGLNTTASGNQSHAEGCGTKAQNTYSHAEGLNTTASGQYTHAEGNGTKALGGMAHAEGYNTTANGDGSHAEGSSAISYGVYSHAEGYGGKYTVDGVEYTSQAVGVSDHTEGYMCLTANAQPGNHAEGYQTQATGGAAHSEGANTKATGIQSHAEGYKTNASYNQSHAEGSVTTASGSQSHAEGYSTTASADQSHAEGYVTIASGTQSHAEGYTTTASGNESHAEGAYTTASGLQAHAEGYNTTASGNRSHSEGEGTIAAGSCSHSGGLFNISDNYDNWPEWTSRMSYAVGDKVRRTVYSSGVTTVTGYVCKTANSDSTFTASKWIDQHNKMNYAEIIGNGEDANNRSNARVLDWDGNERLMGDVYVGCNPDSTGGSKLAKVSELPDVSGKADKDTDAVAGNFAQFDANGNPVDSGHKHSDYLTSHQDISGLAPKASPVFTGSISLGRKANTTVGSNSFAVGDSVTASGNYSNAEGISTNATGYGSHAEGNTTTASKGQAHAEGYGTTASGNQAHAEGRTTESSGSQAHTEGNGTVASGDMSHAEGMATIAQRKSQHVSGEYNTLDSSGTTSTRGNYVEIIGNGTAANARSNARALDWSGNERIMGDIYVNCNSDSTGGTKLENAVAMTGATSSSAGAAGLVPAPSAGDNEKYLRGDGAWANIPSPDISGKADKVSGATAGNFAGLNESGNITDSGKKPSDYLTKMYNVGFEPVKNIGEMINFTINDIWEFDDNVYYSNTGTQTHYILDKDVSLWKPITWKGTTYLLAYNIWNDGSNAYYSYGTSQYVLDKATSTWNQKTWNGLTNFNGQYIWTDGDNIYFSNNSSQYVLNKSTSTWTPKTWYGLTSFNRAYIWTDGNDIYYNISSSSYVLNKSTSTWETKTWSGVSYLSGSDIWRDGENIYYSHGTNHYLLNKSTSAWSMVTWSGNTDFNGSAVWTDGENIYVSYLEKQYIFNKGALKWEDKAWNIELQMLGSRIWVEGDNIYYSYYSFQYILDKSSHTWNKKRWNGLQEPDGWRIWTDGENIYQDGSYVLDKSTSTWTAKTWSGYSNIIGAYVWRDGENVYFSSGSNQYVLDKSTSTWNAKTWNGATNFGGDDIWTDGENIYHSGNSGQFVLDKSTSTWNTKTWYKESSGTIRPYGNAIWSDGENIYYGNGSLSYQYVLDVATSTWYYKTWDGSMSQLYGNDIWTDTKNIYYSNNGEQYILSNKKVLLGTDGEFTPISWKENVEMLRNDLSSNFADAAETSASLASLNDAIANLHPTTELSSISDITSLLNQSSNGRYITFIASQTLYETLTGISKRAVVTAFKSTSDSNYIEYISVDHDGDARSGYYNTTNSNDKSIYISSIHKDSVTGTTSSGGNISKTMSIKVRILSAWTSTGGYVVLPYPQAGADGDGQYTWWFHILNDNSSSTAVSNQNVTVYFTYIRT